MRPKNSYFAALTAAFNLRKLMDAGAGGKVPAAASKHSRLGEMYYLASLQLSPDDGLLHSHFIKK